MVPDSYDSFPLSLGARQALRELGFARPTPIQALSLPPLLAGCDLIGQSQTGSGKTAAFALPLLERIVLKERRVQALVLCPTRELGAQVAQEIRRLGRHQMNLQVLLLCGGHPVSQDRRSLEHGAHVVVGTPGRIRDLLDRKVLDLTGVGFAVLDEADRMLDMGFREKIEGILEKTPASRQTALFSATFPPVIENLAKRYLRNAKRATAESDVSTDPAIEQLGAWVEDEDKTEAVVTFLRARRFESVMIFCNLKVRVDELAEALIRSGHSVDRLHGDLEQERRERVMAKFRNHSTRILVATDVAARGIDVVGLDAVVNYDLPADPSHYVHRIGRTGRAGRAGLALSLVTSRERAKIERIEAYTGAPFPLQGMNPAGAQPPPGPPEPAPMATLAIAGGRKQKLRPGDILGALTGDVGLAGKDVGRIEVLDNVAYVGVTRRSSGVAIEGLRRSGIKGRRFLVRATP